MAVFQPAVNSVLITPNPVNINASFLISVSAADEQVTMYTASYISGAAICGESTTLTNHEEVLA